MPSTIALKQNFQQPVHILRTAHLRSENFKVFPADITSLLRDNDLIPAVVFTDHLNLHAV